MSVIIQKPKCNPIHFVSEEQVDDARYHSRELLQDWYIHQIKGWEDNQPYWQPVQMTDRIRLQFGVTTDSNVSLKLIQCDKRVLHTWAPTSVINLPGNVEPYSGTEQQLYIHYFKIQMSDVSGLGEGVYWLLLQYLDDEQYRYEISEPIHIKADHPDTVFLEYYNQTNDYGAVFEQTNTRFGMRVKGWIDFDGLDSEDTDYRDQEGKLVKLYGQPGETYHLVIDQVAPYALVKLNAILVMDNIRIDGTRYVKNTGAKWELTKTAGVPLQTGSIQLRESDPGLATFTVRPGALKLFEAPDYPFAIFSVFMGEGSANILLEYGGRVISTDGERDAFVNDLNSKAADLDLFGTFDFQAGYFLYNNAAGESYHSTASTVYTTYVTIQLTTSVVNYQVAITMNRAQVVIDWDGTVATAHVVGPLSFNITHTLPYISGYNIRVFGDYELFVMTEPLITGITGQFSARLKTLAINGTGSTTGPASFDGAVLALCENTIDAVSVANTQLATINNFARNFTKLTYVNFVQNKLSTAQVGAILTAVRVYAQNNNVTGGYLTLFSQTPAAPPSAGAAVHKTFLQSQRGWSVLTD